MTQPENKAPDPDRYYGYCPKCGKEIRTNIQGNEMGTHVCENKAPEALSKLADNFGKVMMDKRRTAMDIVSEALARKIDEAEQLRAEVETIRKDRDHNITRALEIAKERDDYAAELNAQGAPGL